MNIDLADGLEISDPDARGPERVGWWRDGNRVTVRGDATITTYTLPRGQRRVAVVRLGSGRSQLVIGGFTKVTVTVTGPSPTIGKLREAVLS